MEPLNPGKLIGCISGCSGYDKNGNLNGVARRNQSGSFGEAPFLMSIAHNSNRLTDFEDGADIYSLGYDASGNMISNQKTGLTGIDYDWRNLPTRMVTGTGTLHFAYDAEGNRVKKSLNGGVTTHYVRGAFGETIAVYENGNRAFVNLLGPGGDMIGSYDGSERRYFLKDHLGSIRATVDQNGNVDSYDDYYPFGLVMPGRTVNVSNPNDHYKFTGHERDDEAGLIVTFI